MAGTIEHEFVCQIAMDFDDEHKIMKLLAKAMPALKWDEGDSAWDKVRVWGESPGLWIRVYRYESPGPFALTICLARSEQYDAILAQVLAALNASVVE